MHIVYMFHDPKSGRCGNEVAEAYAAVDAAFIAHAREDIPALCDRVEELEAALATLPKCSGPWLSGSGGHRVHGACSAYATRGLEWDMYRYCDEHAPGEEAETDLPWADAARAALRGGE